MTAVETRKAKPDDDLVEINIRSVPRGLRQRFKAACAMEGVEMQDCARRLIQAFADGKPGSLAIVRGG